MDFVIELAGKVVPLEIKFGKDYKRHWALNNVLERENYGIEEAYVFSDRNVEIEKKRIYVPIYMISFLKEEEIAQFIYTLDLSGNNNYSVNPDIST